MTANRNEIADSRFGEIVEISQTCARYAVAMTTCAGLWGYLPGDTVCFERRDPPLLRFTGRTRQFLSAFGEHLIGEEVERAVSAAANRCGSDVVDFHVGPVFPSTPSAPGRHRYLVEFAGAVPDPSQFAAALDDYLRTTTPVAAASAPGPNAVPVSPANHEAIPLPSAQTPVLAGWLHGLSGAGRASRLDRPPLRSGPGAGRAHRASAGGIFRIFAGNGGCYKSLNRHPEVAA